VESKRFIYQNELSSLDAAYRCTNMSIILHVMLIFLFHLIFKKRNFGQANIYILKAVLLQTDTIKEQNIFIL
jgi:hypothetical protein